MSLNEFKELITSITNYLSEQNTACIQNFLTIEDRTLLLQSLISDSLKCMQICENMSFEKKILIDQFHESIYFYYYDCNVSLIGFLVLKLILELVPFRKVQAFAQFGSDLDATIQQQLHKGIRLTEMLKQGLNIPLAVEDQVVIIYLGVRDFLDKIAGFENNWLIFIKNNHSDILNEILTKKKISKELDQKLKTLTTNFTNKLNYLFINFCISYLFDWICDLACLYNCFIILYNNIINFSKNYKDFYIK